MKKIGLALMMVGLMVGCGSSGSGSSGPSSCQNPSGRYTMQAIYVSGTCSSSTSPQTITVESFGDMFGDPFGSIDCPGTLNVAPNDCSATVDYTCSRANAYSGTDQYHVSGSVIADDAGFNHAHGTASLEVFSPVSTACSGTYSVVWVKQ